MLSSSATSSGPRRSTSGRTCAPVCVEPTISTSSTDIRARRKPSSIRRLSSAITTRTAIPPCITRQCCDPAFVPGMTCTVIQPKQAGNGPAAQIAFRHMNARPVTELPRVLIAEPDLPTRTGLQLVLESAGFARGGEAGDAATAVALAGAERPELVLIAVELPGGCLDAVRRIASALPRTRVVVLTGDPSGDELVDAALAGAVGYLSRDVRSERLPKILTAVLAGEAAFPRRHMQQLVDALRGRDARRTLLAARTGATLTAREWEVLELLGDEKSTGEIAQRLGIAHVTARRHISSLVAKLGAPDRASAAALGRQRSGG